MDSAFLEKLILKAGLQDKQWLILISTTFEKDYFDDVAAGEVFAFMKGHVEKYGTIAPKEAVINSMDEKIKPSIENFYADIEAVDFDIAKNYDYLFTETNNYLKEKAVKQAILDSVGVVKTGKSEDVGKIRGIIEDALTKDLKIDLGLDYFGTLKDRLFRVLNTKIKRIPTYYPKFDEYLSGGFPPFTFSVIVARVHGFKSNTLANIAARQAMHGHNVVLLTLEMSQDAFAQRFDSIFANLDINRIYTLEATSLKLLQELKKLKEIDHGYLFIKQFPTGEASVMDFKRYLRELTMRDIRPDIIYVDYINLMRPTYSMKGDMYSDVKRIAEELRALSFPFECPVVSVSQLNREGSMVGFTDVDFVYIAESLGVPATADFMCIYGVDDDALVYESELHYKIVKNRLGGRVGEIDKFYYDSRSLKMYDSTELDKWLDDAKTTGDERSLSNLTPQREQTSMSRRGRDERRR